MTVSPTNGKEELKKNNLVTLYRLLSFAGTLCSKGRRARTPAAC